MKIFSFVAMLFTVPLIAMGQQDSTTKMVSGDSLISQIDTFRSNPEPEPVKMLNWNGYLQTDDRMLLNDDFSLYWQEYRLNFKAEFKPSDNARFYSDFWVRSFGFPEISRLDQLSYKKITDPVDIDLREAYFDVYNFLFKNLDLRVGRQRIAWGTGDKFNPTDNLNPYDLEDMWDFGRHLGSNGIKLTYYLKTFTLQGVFIPQYRSPILPDTNWTAAFMPNLSLSSLYNYQVSISPFLPPINVNVHLTGFSDTMVLPARDFKNNPTYGFKVKRKLKQWDLSVSYVYARDVLPVASKLILNVDSFSFTYPTAEVYSKVKAELYFPRMHIAGLDFAGSIGGIGLRGEAALYFPEKVIMKRVALGDPISAPMYLPDSIVLDNEPYLKFVIGLDYTFKNNMYINFQLIHGFLHERGTENLNDYLMLGFDWKLFRDKLRLSILNSGLEIDDWSNITGNYALLYLPEISYVPVDNAEMVLGCRIIDGKSTTGFGKVAGNDELFVRLKYSF
jgi:hypothetical protein